MDKNSEYSVIENITSTDLSDTHRVVTKGGEEAILKIAKNPTPFNNNLITQEYTILAKLKHPNIVRPLHFGTNDEGHVYILLEYVRGLPINECFNCYSKTLMHSMTSILNAIIYIHNAGYVHGDIKPSHILYESQSGKTTLIDFGFSGIASDFKEARGTLAYAAPEILKGRPPDPRSDIYSLGIILVELISGFSFTAFDERQTALVLNQGKAMHSLEDIVKPLEMPLGLKRLLIKMLSIEPALRPNASEIHDLLNYYAGSKGAKLNIMNPGVPPMPFVDTTRHFLILKDARNTIGKAHILTGKVGQGKTYFLNELGFAYRMSGVEVIEIRLSCQDSMLYTLCKYLQFSSLPQLIEEMYPVFENIIDRLRQQQKALRKPLMIMVDDLQKINVVDSKLFRYLGLSVKHDNIGLVAASILDGNFKDAGFTEVPIKTMAYNDVHSIIREIFKGDIEDQVFISWLMKTSGGIPLYLKLTIDLLVNNGTVHFKEGKWGLKDDKYHEMDFPGQVNDLVQQRIDRLDEPARTLLELLCFSDYPLEPPIIYALTGNNYEVEMNKMLGEGLITTTLISNRPAYSPSNEIIRNLVNKKSDPKKLEGFNRAIYPNLMKNYRDEEDYFSFISKVAHDVKEMDDCYSYARRAAVLEEKKYNYDKCCSFYRMALECANILNNGSQFQLLSRIGEIEQQQGNTLGALEAYKEAFNHARDNGEKVSSLIQMGNVQQVIGNYQDSSGYLTKALALLTRHDQQYSKTLASLAYNNLYEKNFTAAETIINDLSCLADETNSPDIKYRSSYLLGVFYWFKGEPAKGIEATKATQNHAERLEQPLNIGLCCNLLATLYQQAGDNENADLSWQKAIEIFDQSKETALLADALINRALTRKRMGHYPEAITLLNRALKPLKRVGNTQKLASLLVNMANVHEILGEYPQALACNRHALDCNPMAQKPLYNLCIILGKMGEINRARPWKKLLSHQDPVLFNLVRIMENIQYKEPKKAMKHIRCGALGLQEKNIDPMIKEEFYLKSAEACYNTKHFIEAREHANEGMKFVPTESREYLILESLRWLCCYCLHETDSIEIWDCLKRLQDQGCLYDWAVLKRMEMEAFLNRPPLSGLFDKMQEDMTRAEEILHNINASFELSRLREVRDMLKTIQPVNNSDRNAGNPLLEAFNAISVLLNMHMGEDDFAGQLIDVIVKLTRAERGALFFVDGGEIKYVAGRNIDKKTIIEAKKLSLSVIGEAQNSMEMIASNDVLHDKRFMHSQSVIMNKIRSILCVPLKINYQAIGVIYLDNTYETHIFNEEDQNFLKTVANFLAVTIDKSLAYQRIKREVVNLKNDAVSKIAGEYLVGNSQSIRNIRETIERIAGINSTVLVVGETGCGKGIVARLIHHKSARKDARFVSINCGAFPETLFEAELFGYKKGAFTGAVDDRKGLFLEADKGTLFLDEISNAPFMVQGKLLEAIEDKQIRRLGENLVHKVDVRLICATNQNLDHLVKNGQFRIDLFYRISVLPIQIPPLRKRTEDIPLLADHFLRKYAKELNPGITGFDQKAIRTMVSYSWPGNVRELQNSIERAVIYARGNYIGSNDLQLIDSSIAPIRMENEYRERIISVLKSTKGNVTMAAQLLGVTRATIYKHAKKLGIDMKSINKE